MYLRDEFRASSFVFLLLVRWPGSIDVTLEGNEPGGGKRRRRRGLQIVDPRDARDVRKDISVYRHWRRDQVNRCTLWKGHHDGQYRGTAH